MDVNSRRSGSSIVVDLISFILIVALAAYNEWKAKDLLWSLWISSLSIGYLTLCAGFAGNLAKGRVIDDVPRKDKNGKLKKNPPGVVLAVFFLIPVIGFFGFSMISGVYAVFALISVIAAFYKFKLEQKGERAGFVLNFIINFPSAAFILAFFTVHFGGFHFVHSIFLNGFYPLINEQPFGKTPDHTFKMVSDFIEISFKNYWPFIIASAATSFASISSAFKGESGNFMFEPYKNVIRMHIMIFVIAFAGAAGLHDNILYAILFLYFFPVSSFFKKKKEEDPSKI